MIDAFEHGDFSAARLGGHGPRYVEAMESLRKLVYAYYDRSFDKIRDILDQLMMKQVIIVSHETKIESFVDHTIQISKQDGVSVVR